MYLVMQMIFATRVVVPAASRWYKCAPIARQTLLGVGCFGLWELTAPVDHRGPAGAGGGAAANDGDAAAAWGLDWHEVHGWRVRKTREFFARGSTASSLILMLKALYLPHTIMRWLMAHESQLLQRAGTSHASSPAGQEHRVWGSAAP